MLVGLQFPYTLNQDRLVRCFFLVLFYCVLNERARAASLSAGSYEQSPQLLDQYKYDHMGSDFSLGAGGDSQLREDLADAMRESPGRQARDCGEFTFVFIVFIEFS